MPAPTVLVGLHAVFETPSPRPLHPSSAQPPLTTPAANPTCATRIRMTNTQGSRTWVPGTLPTSATPPPPILHLISTSLPTRPQPRPASTTRRSATPSSVPCSLTTPNHPLPHSPRLPLEPPWITCCSNATPALQATSHKPHPTPCLDCARCTAAPRAWRRASARTTAPKETIQHARRAHP
ncbi:hypothetical protein IWX90DRAFT_301585 [Phyllosticta citrichinensis]|uniref:Uncharacterized protein n=1 Tax=Phyllosticta citrichinensis TaxID=1130410 RepID=A0ABR1XKX8_9PEZI